MPLSSMTISICPSCTRTEMATVPPSGEYFIAFSRRLVTIRCSFFLSVRKCNSSGILRFISMCLSSAIGRNRSQASEINFARSNSSIFCCATPASASVISSIVLTISIKVSHSSTVLTAIFLKSSADFSLTNVISAMPRILARGLLRSWAILSLISLIASNML